MSDRLRVALLGPGRIATAHLHAIARSGDVAELVAVAGLPHEVERTRALAAEYGAAEAIDDTEALLRRPDIDAVVLTVPNHVHAPLGEAIIAAGKHVLIEKPLTTDVADAQRLVAAAEEHDRVLMVGQCRRFFAGAQRAKALIPQLGPGPLSITHTLGVFAETVATDWWRSSRDTGGLALGLNGPHVVDTILWLMDRPVTRVYARTLRLRDIWEGEDEAVLVLDFADGSLATGILSLNTRPGVNDRWITGANGSMRLVDDRSLWLDDEQVVDEPVVPYIAGDSSFEGQFREFAAAIREGRRPQSDGHDGIAVVRVLAAAHRSHATGQPVDIH